VYDDWIAKAQVAKRPVDDWNSRLERVRGKIGDDGVERLTNPSRVRLPGGAAAQPADRRVPAVGEADDRFLNGRPYDVRGLTG